MHIYFRYEANEPYQIAPMKEEMVTGLAAGVKMFSIDLAPKSSETVLDYYILAENVGAVDFFPVDYPNQPLKVKLSDLNK